ncbi:hypothetical protein H5410_033054 [Solanum commersonii]|uniref:Uncharacterized protein n=1 Tax=Solanum commersonii TaxID=4109 RepID=A0A9J5YRF7_SOLCO|nr:hypothetical protein H5410_033054 [Solanum commersonii]
MACSTLVLMWVLWSERTRRPFEEKEHEDGILLIDETGGEVNAKLEVWRQTLKSKRVQVIQKKGSFNYLEFNIQSKGEIDDDLAYHIGAGWMTWRLASGVLYDKKKIKVVKMRMLRYMYGHTRRAKIRNNVMRDKVEVASIEDKMQEARRCTNAPVRKWERLVMNGFRRGRGRPRKYRES